MSKPVAGYRAGDMARRPKPPGRPPCPPPSYSTLPRDTHQRAMRAALEAAWRAEQRRPINRLGRAIGGLWRSIASGGWE